MVLTGVVDCWSLSRAFVGTALDHQAGCQQIATVFLSNGSTRYSTYWYSKIARICEPISHFLESKQKMWFQHHVALIYSIDFTFLLVGSENHEAKLLPDGCSFPSYVIGVSIWWYECIRYLVVNVYILYIPAGLEREVIDQPERSSAYWRIVYISRYIYSAMQVLGSGSKDHGEFRRML